MTRSRIGAISVASDEALGGGIDRRRTILAPDPAAHDPILLWGEDWFRRGAFNWHPHRGFETVTYVAAGEMELADSTGARGRLGPGDVQWTTAGSGFFHDGQPVGDSLVHGMQLWLNLPRHLRMSPPREQVLPRAAAPTIGKAFQCRVFAGTMCGETGPADLLHPATFAELRFEGGELDIEMDANQTGAIYVLTGALSVDGHVLQEGQAARIRPGEAPMLAQCLEPGLALLAAGLPIGEPTVMDGPFVMSTQVEINEAYADLEDGKMGAPPTSVPA